MQLKAVRVVGFRSIKDSGWVQLSPLTGIVGENESGKTSLLLAISRLDFAAKFREDDVSSLYDNQTFVEAEFRLTNREFESILGAKKKPRRQGHVVIRKTFDNKYSAAVDGNELFTAITTRKFRVVDAPETEKEWSDSLWASYRGVADDVGKAAVAAVADTDNKTLKRLVSEVASSFNTKWGTPVAQLKRIREQVRVLQEEGLFSGESGEQIDSEFCLALGQDAEETTESVESKLARLMPKLVYFDKYDQIEGTYTLDKLEKLGAESTIWRLMNLAGVDPSHVLDSSESKREQLQAKAKAKISGMLSRHWQQREVGIVFRFGEADGVKQLSLLVESKNSIPIPLQQRSEGFRWFLSFYVALNHANSDLRNTVFLLDDPAVSLHAKGQRDAYESFTRLVKKENVIVFSTHSPFLVDLKNLHRYRLAVNRESEGLGTQIEDPLLGDEELPIQPLFAAMGCPVPFGLLPDQFYVVPEGPIDYYLFHAILSIAKSAEPELDCGVMPARNAGDVVRVASICKGLGLRCIGLLDGDKQGEEVIAALTKHGMQDVIPVKKISDFAEYTHLESAFEYDDYCAAVVESHELDSKEYEAMIAEPPRDHNYKRHIQGLYSKGDWEKVGGNSFSGISVAKALATQYDSVLGFKKPPVKLVKKSQKFVKELKKSIIPDNLLDKATTRRGAARS